MSDQTLEERLLEQLDSAKRNGVENLGPLYSLTGEVGALEREHHIMTGMTIAAWPKATKKHVRQVLLDAGGQQYGGRRAMVGP